MALPPPASEKRGAGLLLLCEGELLLLLRRSTHNDRHWGLPGGNVEARDPTLQATALREATEELGALPPLQLLAELLTTRGQRGEKHYTVFLCRVERSVRAAWVPRLNEEHREWRWFPVAAVAAAVHGVGEAPVPLHPVVAALVAQHARALRDAAAPPAKAGKRERQRDRAR